MITWGIPAGALLLALFAAYIAVRAESRYVLRYLLIAVVAGLRRRVLFHLSQGARAAGSDLSRGRLPYARDDGGARSLHLDVGRDQRRHPPVPLSSQRPAAAETALDDRRQGSGNLFPHGTLPRSPACSASATGFRSSTCVRRPPLRSRPRPVKLRRAAGVSSSLVVARSAMRSRVAVAVLRRACPARTADRTLRAATARARSSGPADGRTGDRPGGKPCACSACRASARRPMMCTGTSHDAPSPLTLAAG